MNSFATAPAAPDASDRRLEAVHLGDMTRLLSGRWRLLAGAGIAAFAASVLFVTLVPPRYTGEAKLILEADGRRWHNRVAAQRHDRARDKAAARAGWQTMRFCHEELADDADGEAQAIRETYEERCRLLSGAP